MHCSELRPIMIILTIPVIMPLVVLNNGHLGLPSNIPIFPMVSMNRAPPHPPMIVLIILFAANSPSIGCRILYLDTPVNARNPVIMNRSPEATICRSYNNIIKSKNNVIKILC